MRDLLQSPKSPTFRPAIFSPKKLVGLVLYLTDTFKTYFISRLLQKYQYREDPIKVLLRWKPPIYHYTGDAHHIIVATIWDPDWKRAMQCHSSMKVLPAWTTLARQKPTWKQVPSLIRHHFPMYDNNTSESRTVLFIFQQCYG